MIKITVKYFSNEKTHYIFLSLNRTQKVAKCCLRFCGLYKFWEKILTSNKCEKKSQSKKSFFFLPMAKNFFVPVWLSFLIVSKQDMIWSFDWKNRVNGPPRGLCIRPRAGMSNWRPNSNCYLATIEFVYVQKKLYYIIRSIQF